MQSTYLIYGPQAGDATHTQSSLGTAFLMGKPHPDGSPGAFFVLITAGHVLDDIEGDIATLKLHQLMPDGSYNVRDWQIRIRHGNANDYVKPPDADVAALYINLPSADDVSLVPTGLLATDDILKRYELHPGDELRSLGFPYGVCTPGCFPVLRTGGIASYPIVPTSIYKMIYYDMSVFQGNSGGPVYFSQTGRAYGGVIHLDEDIHFVVGLVDALTFSKLNGQEVRLAQVIPSPYILEAVGMLPPAPPTGPSR
jgi:hypothetical protein